MAAITKTKTKTLDKLALDGGNAFLKWSYGSTLECCSSWAAHIEDDKQEIPSNAIQTRYFGERWVFGDVARDLGGQPLFDYGKEAMTPILLKAVLESTGYEAVNELIILVPDNRKDVWDNQVKEQILATVPVTTIRFVSEGVPPHEWATKTETWRFPHMQNAVLDCGGGDLSLRLFTSSGVIDWDKSITIPGTKKFAEAIANRIDAECTYTPTAGQVLNAIENNRFDVMDDAKLVDFTAHYERLRVKWMDSIRSTIRSKWQSQGVRVGQVMIIGGGSHLLQDMVGENRPYFIPQEKRVGNNFPQLINAYSMAQMQEG